MTSHPFYRYLSASGMFAGWTCLAAAALMPLLAFCHYASLLTGGPGIMPVIVGMAPLMITLMLPTAGLGIGNLINWHAPDSDDELHLAVWLAIGQACAAAMLLPSLMFALSHALSA